MTDNLFDKNGGFDTFSAVVKSFYQKVLDNEQLEHYFTGVNMDRLISHQTNFISRVLGGPDNYVGSDLKAAHASFKITTAGFNLVAELLEEALEEADVEEDISQVISKITALKDSMVSA